MPEQVAEVVRGRGTLRHGLEIGQETAGRHLVGEEGGAVFVRHVHHGACDASSGLKGPSETGHSGDLVEPDAATGIMKTDRNVQLMSRKGVERYVVLRKAAAVGERYTGILHDGSRLGRRRHRILVIR